jgi:Acyltransferase family
MRVDHTWLRRLRRYLWWLPAVLTIRYMAAVFAVRKEGGRSGKFLRPLDTGGARPLEGSRGDATGMVILHRAGAQEIPYRADIDGLRAIAVLAVIGFHANPAAVPGGFVGVDIFFVVSGFLITSLILTKLRDGSFSFMEFYARRIRRLFPALVVVLLATWSLGWFILPPTEYAALGRHTLAGAAFAANILSYSEVGYFDVPAAAKPLLHLWSLGVEEQFYIVFPALLLLLWRYRAIGLSLALIGIVSFALNIALVRHHPAFTFYLPLTRFWDFMAGGLLACSYLLRESFRLPTRFELSGPRWRDVEYDVSGLAALEDHHRRTHPGRPPVRNRRTSTTPTASSAIYLFHWKFEEDRHAAR